MHFNTICNNKKKTAFVWQGIYHGRVVCIFRTIDLCTNKKYICFNSINIHYIFLFRHIIQIFFKYKNIKQILSKVSIFSTN